MKMKLISLLSAGILAVSCGVNSYVIDMEMRTASPSGLSLAGKSIAVVYADDGMGTDSLYNHPVAQSLATALESSYFDLDEAALFKVDGGGSHLVKDSLVNMVLRTGYDVVFMLEKPALNDTGAKKTLLSRMGVYDSMHSEDKLYLHSVETELHGADSVSSKEAMLAGLNLAVPFEDTWKRESYTLYSMDYGSTDWDDALNSAYMGDWQNAMNIWMRLAQKGPAHGRGGAAYDVALGLFFMKDYNLALEWLDLADSLADLPNSKALRKRITSKLPSQQ